jgi:hypothetical protein
MPGVFGIRVDINRIDIGETFNRTAYITGLEASAPRLPKFKMAVPLEILQQGSPSPV